MSEAFSTTRDERMYRLDRFAADLRELRRHAGEPSLRKVAARIRDSGHSLSVTSLNDIFSGKRLPTWEALIAIVAALDADIKAISPQWEAVIAVRHVSRAGRESEEFAQKYLKQVAVSSYRVTLPDTRYYKRVYLDDIYVEQMVKDLANDRVRSLFEVESKVRHIVLLGGPGSGKSTACQAIMHRHATTPGAHMPFLINVREFFSKVPPELSVVGMIEHIAETVFQARPPEGYVAKQLTDGHALVIFDGLDELLSTEAARSTSSIIELFCREFPLAQVIATSRLAGYERAALDGQLFEVFRLEEFTQDQVLEYVTNWLALSELPPEEAEEWLEASNSIAEIRANPLLLSFAAQLFSDRGHVPRSKLSLLQSMIDLLLNQWDRVRGIKVGASYDQAYLEPLLSLLAFQMIDRGSGQISENELIDEWTSYLIRELTSPIEAGPMAREFLSAVRERSSLLSEAGVSSVGQPILIFTHRTFMEYLAALYIASSDDSAKLIAKLLQRSDVRPVLELALTLSEQKRPGSADTLLSIASDIAQDLGIDVRKQVKQYRGLIGSSHPWSSF